MVWGLVWKSSKEAFFVVLGELRDGNVSEREQRERERAEGVVEEEKEMAKGRVPRGMGWWDTEIYTCKL